ncbi:MAG: hypothetical protein ACJ73Z_06700 [Rubrobacteraceae bacterium]
MADRRVLRVTLRYTSIDSPFDRPDVSPFSKDFNEYSTMPGIELIYNELQANPALKRVETTIVLPPEQITPDLEQSTREAVRRYCLARSREVGQSERALRWRALRALAIALLLFVVYVVLQWKLKNIEILAIKVILEGLDILIWVALWFPLDALFFGLQSYDINSGSYKRASQMQLKIEPA